MYKSSHYVCNQDTFFRPKRDWIREAPVCVCVCDTVYVSADRLQHGATDWEMPTAGDVGHQSLLRTHRGHLAQHHTGRGGREGTRGGVHKLCVCVLT